MKNVDFSIYDFSESVGKGEEDSIDYYDFQKNEKIEKLSINAYEEKKKDIFKGFEYCKSITLFINKFSDEVQKLNKENKENKSLIDKNKSLIDKNPELEKEIKDIKTRYSNLTNAKNKLEKEMKEMKEAANRPVQANPISNSSTNDLEFKRSKTENIQLSEELKRSLEENKKLEQILKQEKESKISTEDKNKQEQETIKLRDELRKSQEENKKLEQENKKYSCAYYCNLSLYNNLKSHNTDLLRLLMIDKTNIMEEEICRKYDEKIKLLENEIETMKNKISKEIWDLPKIHTDKEAEEKINQLYSTFVKVNTDLFQKGTIERISSVDCLKIIESLSSFLEKDFLAKINLKSLQKKLIENKRCNICSLCEITDENINFVPLQCGCYICKKHNFTQFDLKFHNKKNH